MKNQYIWVDITVTDLDRAINHYSAVLGGQVKKESAQDFVLNFNNSDPLKFRFSGSVHDL